MKKVEVKQKMKELRTGKRSKYVWGGVGGASGLLITAAVMITAFALVCVLLLFLLVFPVKKFQYTVQNSFGTDIR